MAMKECFIFDLDGTLADDSHRAHHIPRGEWDEYFSKCPADRPIKEICILARLLSLHYPVFIISGRSESVQSETLDWLKKHEVPFTALTLRKRNDLRPNSQLKAEALATLRSAGYRPLLVFEDQPKVCEEWRKAGVPVAQVGGKIDFVEYTRT